MNRRGRYVQQGLVSFSIANSRLSISSQCLSYTHTALSSSHRAGWLLRCLSLCHPLFLSSCRPSSPHHCLAVAVVHHQIPPPSPPLNTVSIVHRCHICYSLPPVPPSNANAHLRLRPSPLSNADTRRRHPSPLSPHHRLSVAHAAIAVKCPRLH